MAGCCWRPIAQQQSTRTDGSPTPYRNGDGVVELQAYPDCTAAYTGARRSETVYIVGWRTPHERLFAAGQGRAAVVYRNETDRKLAIDQVQAGNLCALAVEELWA